jgi:hypothetical protein
MNIADASATASLPKISFGLDVRQPARLETRGTGEVLRGILRGDWRDAVGRVRELPADSAEQKAAKVQLPYCLWAGVFTRRANNGLVRHSGQVGLDLDGLGEAGAVAVLQTAVADVHCLAAFRSARGEGVRLIFRIPPCSPENHGLAFEQVALHVQRTYGREPDRSGSDVSRASFVSFDNGLWFNAAAEVLPIVLPGYTQRLRTPNRCVYPSPYAGQLAVTCWDWYGRHFANVTPAQNGIAKTHESLLSLGKAIALHAARMKEPLVDRFADIAIDSWLAEHTRNGLRLRFKADVYRDELRRYVRDCEGKPWFRPAVERWTRWTRHREFPHNGLPHFKILFAIRQHCADARSDEFFLGARDAALVAGVCFKTAAVILNKLVVDGHLKKLGARRHTRHAQEFRLIEQHQHRRKNERKNERAGN